MTERVHDSFEAFLKTETTFPIRITDGKHLHER